MASGTDFFNLNELFDEESRLVRDTVRQFVDDQVLPIIADYYEKGEFPSQLIPQMGEMGIFGANLEGYGCAGMSSIAYGLIMQELERGDSGLRSFASVQGALVMYPIHTFGSDEQKEKWLPAMAKGEKIGCFGLTEPDHGSDPGGMVTRAKNDGDGYVLNGAKMWITNGTVADVAVVWAKDESGDVRGFLVEKGTPGYSTRETKRKFSLRASDTSELIFEDCHIPGDAIFPARLGLKMPLMCLTQARAGIAWGVLGAAMACFEEAVEYAKSRIQFDKPIAAFQLTQKKLADILTDITKGQLLAYRLGQLKDSGQVKHYHVSLAKRNNVAMALETARICRQILGANGITAEYSVMRHMCNLESVITYEGTHDIHTLILGQEITGHNAIG